MGLLIKKKTSVTVHTVQQALSISTPKGVNSMALSINAARTRTTIGVMLALLCSIGASQAAERTYVTEIPELLSQSPASDWEAIADNDLVLLELATGTVVAELAPFASPAHVAQWRSLILDGYYKDSAVLRAQENYVVQWGESTGTRSPGEAGAKLPNENSFEFTPSMADKFVALGAVDSYAPTVGFIDSFPVGIDKARERAWMLYCHGVVGTVQADPKTTPGGVYYYVSIGNPTRELDAKLPVVGRVIEGIDVMSTLPRGDGVYGFLDEAKYVPIQQTRLVSDMPAETRPHFERLRTDSQTFATLLRMRGASLAKDSPASAPYPVDVCSIPLPARRKSTLSAID